MAHERATLALAVALLGACPNDPGGSTDSTQTLSPESTMTMTSAEESSSTTTDAVDESTGATTTTSSESSSSGGGDAGGCNLANGCEVGYCVAPYADNDRGDFVCVPDCVMPADEARWCFDATACCDAAATCTERGYCVSPDDTTSSSSG